MLTLLLNVTNANTTTTKLDGRIVFAKFTSGDDSDIIEIYVMNADGSGQTRLTNNGNDFQPTWSPDGKT